MENEIDIKVVCPNCERVHHITNDNLVFLEKCTHEICERDYIVVIDHERNAAYTELMLIDFESKKHLQFLLEDHGVIPPTQDEIDADDDQMCGIHHDGNMWVAFDRPEGEFLRVERFRKVRQAIEWLGQFVMERGIEKAQEEEALARRRARPELIDKLLLTSAILGLLMCGLVIFTHNEAHADNLQSLASFTQGGSASQPVKKAYFQQLDYPALKDAVAGGKVEATYAAIAAFAKTSPNETERAIKKLEADGVIRWNKTKFAWELVK